MTRTYIAFAIILTIFSSLFIVLGIYQKQNNEILDSVDAMIITFNDGDFASSLEKAEDASRLWYNHSGFFKVVARHENLNAINSSLTRTIEYIIAKDKTLFAAESAVLSDLLMGLYENEQFTFSNIF